MRSARLRVEPGREEDAVLEERASVVGLAADDDDVGQLRRTYAERSFVHLSPFVIAHLGRRRTDPHRTLCLLSSCGLSLIHI